MTEERFKEIEKILDEIHDEINGDEEMVFISHIISFGRDTGVFSSTGSTAQLSAAYLAAMQQDNEIADVILLASEVYCDGEDAKVLPN